MGFPNRERKQRHAGHFRKPKPEKKLPVAVQKAREEADPYKDGRTRIFLDDKRGRSEEHTSELQSLMRISYAVFCLKKKKTTKIPPKQTTRPNQPRINNTSPNHHMLTQLQHRQTRL